MRRCLTARSTPCSPPTPSPKPTGNSTCKIEPPGLWSQICGLGRELLTLPPAGHATGRRRESATLHRIVQSFELVAFVHTTQGVQDELVGKPGVLGE